MALNKVVYYSLKNCFVYFNSNYKDLFNEQDIIEVIHKENSTKLYLSINFTKNSKYDENIILIDSKYAKCLNIADKDNISINKVIKDKKYASSITIQPTTIDDWQILELNINNIENNLLNQIKVVFRNQLFPIWIDSNVCIFVKTISYEPNTDSYICINSFTRLIVETPVEPAQSTIVNNSISTTNNYLQTCYNYLINNKNTKNQNECLYNYYENNPFSFNIKPNLRNQQSIISSKCSNLTSVYINKSVIESIINGKIEKNKLLVKLKHIESPIMNNKNKELLKRFINSIEYSYSEDYLANSNKTSTIYALLDIIDDHDIIVDSSKTHHNDFHIELSEFLIRQTNICDLSLIQVTLLNPQEIKNCNMESITLKTNCIDVDNVKSSFLRYIDENSLCLCPLVFTDNQILELKNGDDVIKCQIKTSGPFIALNSSTNSINITVDSNVLHSNNQLIDIELLKPKLFPIKVIQTSWFQKIIDQIIEHTDNNLINKSKFCHGLIIQGTKGSGKSVFCKYICNLYTTKHANLFYEYVNCQYFMGKSIDAIHDQLRLIYDEAIWCNKSIVCLDNLDYLMENVNSETDPNAKLYCYQLIEVLKAVMINVWDKNARVITIATSTRPLNELPLLFHCLDEHGLFTSFIQLKPINKLEADEIIDNILIEKQIKFDDSLLNAINDHIEGCVFKDIEKLIEKILFANWRIKKETNLNDRVVYLNDVHDVIYNYKSINMLETNFFKAKNMLNWSLIGGLETIKQTLVESIIWPIKYESLYKQLGMKQSAGVLLYGPSGCGKTLIASALANESKLNFISVKGPELLSKYIGSSEHNVRDLFRKANKAKPCVIFFDEFDSIAPKRGHDSTGVTDRVVNQLLTELDGVEQLDGVYLLAATSRPDLIDQALVRPGRIDKHVYIGFPTNNEIQEVIKIYCKQVKIDDDVDLDSIAQLCDGFSGADIKSLICDALIKAFHRLCDKNLNINDAIDSKWNDFYQMKFENEESNEKILMENIVINKSDFLSSISTIEKTINKAERRRLHQLYENWKNTKSFGDKNSEKKSKATLA